MKESDMQSKFTAWMDKSDYYKNAAWELKLSKENNALAFNSFRPQQLPSLYKAKHNRVFKKLSDMDPTLKPFDCMQVCYAEAWVIAGWHHERKGITAYWIDIDVFLQAQKESQRKSITESECATLASRTIHL